jgi:hypothetical protein
MEELLREHLGEIALLIYILYPLLKRWWDRQKQKREQSAGAPDSAEQPPLPHRPPRKPQIEPPVAKQSSEADLLEAARAQRLRLKQASSALLARAESEPLLARLVPAVRDDLLGRLQDVERSLNARPTVSSVVHETTVMRGLESLLRYLKMMAQQRMLGGSGFLSEADAIADACYAPLIEFAGAQGLDLKSSQPIIVTGDWDLSIVPRFASTRLAPLRLPRAFEQSLWSWPAIAHEIAHDFYFSLRGLEPGLRARLGLPSKVEMPMSSAELDGAWLRNVFGAWLPEVVADTLGTMSLGPAYVETMLRAFRNPSSPQRTAAILQDRSLIDEHPPPRLRLYMATRVLHHLGRHEEADALWARWEADHPEVGFYFLPLGGQWVGLSDEALHSVADSVIDTLVQRGWPELEGFHLMNIPGFSYQHAEHAEVTKLSAALVRGEQLDADVRWIIAAAVLAAAAQPALHDPILRLARLSIAGRAQPAVVPVSPRRGRASETIGEILVASLRQPEAIKEAVILGAAIRPYKPPRWH